MERANRISLLSGTVVDVSPERPYNSFLKVTVGNAVLRFSLTEAGAIHELLDTYFSQVAAEDAMAGSAR